MADWPIGLFCRIERRYEQILLTIPNIPFSFFIFLIGHERGRLRSHFDEPQHFALVLDLIKGGEMFDHLVESGAYSELDGTYGIASHMVLETRNVPWQMSSDFSTSYSQMSVFKSKSTCSGGNIGIAIYAWHRTRSL